MACSVLVDQHFAFFMLFQSVLYFLLVVGCSYVANQNFVYALSHIFTAKHLLVLADVPLPKTFGLPKPEDIEALVPKVAPRDVKKKGYTLSGLLWGLRE